MKCTRNGACDDVAGFISYAMRVFGIVFRAIMLRIYCLSFLELSALVLAGTVIFLLFYCMTRKRKWLRSMMLTFSTVYVLIVLIATLLGRSESPASQGVSLIPFASYIKFFQGETEMLRESIMNIVFFYPLGLLLGGAASEKLPRKRSLVLAFLLSLFIECCQWIFNLGYAEVDDVMHNTLGAALGLLVMHLVERIDKGIQSKRRGSSP